MKCGVVVFPGSNCDHDAYHVFKDVLEQETVFLWHGDEDVQGCELIILPGGFAYGDYLRGGALAALSPIMVAIKRHAEAGGRVLGICNGFQVLLEAGLLPGALRPNSTLRFECRDVCLRVEQAEQVYTSGYSPGQVLRIPIAHGEGCYIDSSAALDRLEAAGQVVFRYVDPQGELSEDWNINGSARAIAGICNLEGNVLGMMPHPERCSEAVLGNQDGLALLKAAVAAVAVG